MPLNTVETILIVIAIALGAMATRFTRFYCFRKASSRRRLFPI